MLSPRFRIVRRASLFVLQNSAEKIASSQYRKLKGIVDDERTKLESSRMREGKVETTFSCTRKARDSNSTPLWDAISKKCFFAAISRWNLLPGYDCEARGLKKHPYVVRKKSIVSSRFNWMKRPSLSHLFLAFFLCFSALFTAPPLVFMAAVLLSCSEFNFKPGYFESFLFLLLFKFVFVEASQFFATQWFFGRLAFIGNDWYINNPSLRFFFLPRNVWMVTS